MEVVLLGSGSADGWPNPFCRCASCESARADGIVRGQSAALIDGRLLLDAGPEVRSAAVRHGVRLDNVRHILVGHAHADHLGPQLLLFRSWVSDEPLDVVGPPAVVDACRDWVAPDAAVQFRAVAAGESFDLDGYRVRVLPAAHRVFDDGDAVLFDVTAPDGARLLWACDTGPWEPAWVEAVAGAAFDVVLLEETFGVRDDLGAGHLHLVTFADLVRQLRAVGAITATTEVRAVHLSHHNPPEADLAVALAAVGARPGLDGERWDCAPPVE